MRLFSNPFINNVFVARNTNSNSWKFDPTRDWDYYIEISPEPKRIKLEPGNKLNIEIITSQKYKRCTNCYKFFKGDDPEFLSLCEDCAEGHWYPCILGNIPQKRINKGRCDDCIHWESKCSNGNIFYLAAYTINHKIKVGVTTIKRLYQRSYEGGYNAVLPFYKKDGGTFSRIEAVRIENLLNKKLSHIISSMGFPYRNNGIYDVQGVFSENGIQYTLDGITMKNNNLESYLKQFEKEVEEICENLLDIQVKSIDPFIPNYQGKVNFKKIKMVQNNNNIRNFSNLRKLPFLHTVMGERIRRISGKIIAAKYPSLIIENDNGDFLGVLLRKKDYRGKSLFIKDYRKKYERWFKNG